MNRTTPLALAVLLASSMAMGASPPGAVSYQGVLRDAVGTPLTGDVDMVARFWSAPSGGEEILVDRHTVADSAPVDVKSGLFNVVLGGGSLIDGAGGGTYTSLSDVFRDYGDVWVGIQVGTDSEMAPRLRVLSTAFALNADRLDGLSSDDFAVAGHNHDGEYLKINGGSLSGTLGISGAGLTVNGMSTSSPISLVAGSAPSNGIGGAIDLTAGGGYNNRGGHVSITSGNTSSWSSSGNSSDVWLRGGTVDGQLSYSEVRVQGGRAVAGGTPHSDGGVLTLRGGNATGTDRNGGNVLLLPGAATGSGTAGRVGVGTGSPQARLDVAGGDVRTDGRLVSTVTTGTAPLAVSSTTRVNNLNAQYLDGHGVSDFALAGECLDVSGGSLSGTLGISGAGLTVDGMSTSSPISLVAGSAPSNGIGGAIDLTAGGGYNNRGGHVTITSGNTSSWSSFGNSSDVVLRGGTVDGQVGFAEVRIQGGRAVAGGTPHSDGGVLTLRGGDATGTNRNGGNVILLPGAATGSGTAGRIGVGTSSPQARLDVAGGDLRTDGRLISTVSTGTAPLAVSSTTRVDGLNAQYLDGHGASDFARTTDLHTRYTDAETVSAMGAKSDDNPLHHDRPTATEIAEAAPKSKRIALRKWYAASTAATFSAGLGAEGMVFDGEHVWIANRDADTVTKIRASDGAPMGDYAVGSQPRSLAFDGQYVWVGGYVGQLTKLRAYDGAVMDTVNLGTRIDDVEIDGTNLWVAHGNMSGTISKVRPSDGVVLATYASGGSCPIALEFDGTNLWIANWCSSGVVAKMDPADGSILGTYGVFTCNDLAFDGENVWVTDGSDNQVVKLRASDGANQGTIAVGTNPGGVTFDGTHVWVLNSADDTVSKLRAVDGTVVDTFATGDAPARAVFDGGSIWISNSGDGTASKL